MYFIISKVLQDTFILSFYAGSGQKVFCRKLREEKTLIMYQTE